MRFGFASDQTAECRSAISSTWRSPITPRPEGNPSLSRTWSCRLAPVPPCGGVITFVEVYGMASLWTTQPKVSVAPFGLSQRPAQRRVFAFDFLLCHAAQVAEATFASGNVIEVILSIWVEWGLSGASVYHSAMSLL